MLSTQSESIQLENAIRAFFQSIKRPQYWSYITTAAGVHLDRPSAVILQTLMLQQPKKLGVQDLALLLGIEPPSVTRKTQQLESAGYLRRWRNPSDRRAVSLEVTKEGREVAQQLWKAQRNSMNQVLKSWSSSDRQNFVQLFERFANELNAATDTNEHTIKKGL